MIHAARPSSRPARSIRKKSPAALNATDVTTFFGHVKFFTDPGHHGLQDAHQMVLAQWQIDQRQARPSGGLARRGEVRER